MTLKQVVLTCKVSDGQRKLSKRCSRSQTLLCMFQRAPQTEPQRCVKREVVRQMRADCPGVGWVGGRTVATDVAGARRSMFHTPLVSPSGQRRTTAGGKGQHSQFCWILAPYPLLLFHPPHCAGKLHSVQHAPNNLALCVQNKRSKQSLLSYMKSGHVIVCCITRVYCQPLIANQLETYSGEGVRGVWGRGAGRWATACSASPTCLIAWFVHWNRSGIVSAETAQFQRDRWCFARVITNKQ